LSAEHEGPIPGSYWVEPGRLLAGPYPEDPGALVASGIAATLDLTESGEGWADYWSAQPELEHHRIGLQDFARPSEGDMRRVLAAIDELLERGLSVYVHCRGGRGRTGCVVGCYLIERGAAPPAALESIRQWCGHDHSPETDEQRELVRTWRAARPAADASTPPRASS
jgi:predicted metal-dependent hydrolase